MTTVLDTSTMPSGERFRRYHETINRVFVPLDVADGGRPDTFSACISAHTLGAMDVVSVQATPHTVVRTAEAAAGPDRACYMLTAQVRGNAVLSQDGRAALLRPGHLAIHDTTRHYSWRQLDAGHAIVVFFPQLIVRTPPATVATLTARAMPGHVGVGRALSQLVTGLDPLACRFPGPVAEHMGNALLELVCAWITEHVLTDEPKSRREALAKVISDYIDRHLSEPDLTCASIAAAHHISSSYLQKIFAAQNTSVSAVIRDRRLERCRADLSDPLQARRSAIAIANRWGLSDPSHFSRLFKSTFDATPGEFRAQALSVSTAR